MSRAFVKEDGPRSWTSPTSNQPPPNWVTPVRPRAASREARRADQADWRTCGADGVGLDREPEAAAKRDIRYLEARVGAAMLVEARQSRSRWRLGRR